MYKIDFAAECLCAFEEKELLGSNWHRLNPGGKDLYRRAIRDVLTNLREPAHAAVAAVKEKGSSLSESEIAQIWRDMMDVYIYSK